MHARIINRTPQLLIVPLNSGKTVHLAPSETSKALAYVEINGNVKIEKLLANRSISLVHEETAASRSEGKHGAAGDSEEARRGKREPEHEKEIKRETRKK